MSFKKLGITKELILNPAEASQMNSCNQTPGQTEQLSLTRDAPKFFPMPQRFPILHYVIHHLPVKIAPDPHLVGSVEAHVTTIAPHILVGWTHSDHVILWRV